MEEQDIVTRLSIILDDYRQSKYCHYSDRQEFEQAIYIAQNIILFRTTSVSPKRTENHG